MRRCKWKLIRLVHKTQSVLTDDQQTWQVEIWDLRDPKKHMSTQWVQDSKRQVTKLSAAKEEIIDISQFTHYYLYIIWILRVLFAYSARLFLDFNICHSYTKDWQQHFCLHSPWNAQNKNVLNAIIKTANNFVLRSVVLPLLLAFALAFARQSLLFHLNPSLGALGN